MVSNKSGGGIKVANNLITTEKGYALDARQGKVLDEKIVETKDDLLKMIQASGILSGNVDWNIYVSPGVYIVQNAIMTVEYHAPVGLYEYGLLIVMMALANQEKRILHVYYPHMNPYASHPAIDIVECIRMKNGDIWTPWWKISGQLL